MATLVPHISSEVTLRVGAGGCWPKLKSVGGVGWLRTFLKCSIHLASHSSSLRSALPSLPLIGTPELLLELVSSRTILYSVFVLFFSAASCASLSSSSSHLLLSFLQLFFTSLSMHLYSSSSILHPEASSYVLFLSCPSSVHQSISMSCLLSIFPCSNPFFFFLRLSLQSQRWCGRTSPTAPRWLMDVVVLQASYLTPQSRFLM